jgi:hypothetical protein
LALLAGPKQAAKIRTSIPHSWHAICSAIAKNIAQDHALEAFSKAFGATSVDDENYNPLADYDHDGDVDGSDLAVFAKNFKDKS